MPLSTPVARREVHHRLVDMKTYARDDGMYDVEAHLVDAKPFPLTNEKSGLLRQPGEPIHDLWVRLTIDQNYVVVAVEGAANATPYPLCGQAKDTLQVMVGEAVVAGWSKKVKQRLRGAAGCTHFTEMLVTMATAAYQGIRVMQRYKDGVLSPKGVEMLDTCYSYSAEREVIKQYWPELYRSGLKGEPTPN